MTNTALLLVLSAIIAAQPAASSPTSPPSPTAEEGASPTAQPEPKPPVPDGAAVYRTISGREAQVVFTSDAPLEKIVGKSNAVLGFAVGGPKDQPARLAQARWVLPVKSLATGIPLRDEHILHKEWLDGEAHPVIEFTLVRVDDIKEIKKGDGFTTWSAALVGNMSIRGVTREMTVKDARLTFFAASEKTKSIAPGDLLFLKCDYTVKLSDFEVKNGDVPKKVSDTVTISQTLRMTTADLSSVGKPAAGEPAAPPQPAQGR